MVYATRRHTTVVAWYTESECGVTNYVDGAVTSEKRMVGPKEMAVEDIFEFWRWATSGTVPVVRHIEGKYNEPWVKAYFEKEANARLQKSIRSS
jgi:hypothetical protein